MLLCLLNISKQGKISMKKAIVILFLVMFGMVSMTAIVSADSKTGQKIFKKKFRKKCGFSGVKFSRHHTQSEWKELWEGGKFKEEAKKICPRLKIEEIKESWWEHLYDFSYQHASDGVVPEC